LQAKAEPRRDEVKANFALTRRRFAVTTLCGCSMILVCGGVVSTVTLLMAGVGSVFPAGSVARTLNVWVPWARPE
jgi:hypothetical protein